MSLNKGEKEVQILEKKRQIITENIFLYSEHPRDFIEKIIRTFKKKFGKETV